LVDLLELLTVAWFINPQNQKLKPTGQRGDRNIETSEEEGYIR
jgi:hypothetical protein